MLRRAPRGGRRTTNCDGAPGCGSGQFEGRHLLGCGAWHDETFGFNPT